MIAHWMSHGLLSGFAEAWIRHAEPDKQPVFNTARDDSTTTRGGEHFLNEHQKRLVDYLSSILLEALWPLGTHQQPVTRQPLADRKSDDETLSKMVTSPTCWRCRRTLHKMPPCGCPYADCGIPNWLAAAYPVHFQLKLIFSFEKSSINQ